MVGLTRIGIVGGAGWLGGAIARSLVKSGIVSEAKLGLSYRSRRPDFLPRAFWTLDNQALTDWADILVISVRPEDWSGLSMNLDGKLLISVMAAIRAEALCLRHNTRRVVRALPNAAAEVCLSYTPWLASLEVTQTDKAIVQKIFSACGTQDEVFNEAQIDYLTGLTGTGPAYPALLAFAMLQDARSHGLSEEVALRAVNGIFIGMGGLLQLRPEDPERTVNAFLEYQGVTAAGLNAMKDSGFLTAVSGGLAAASEKTAEMTRQRRE